MAHTASAHGDNYLNHSSGIMSWLKTLDHKRIGLMYLVSILSFFLVGGLLALVVRWELFTPEADLLGPDMYNRAFTLHGAIMVFVVLVPSIPASIGNFVLPLMLGAKDVAFPKLNLLSFYIYVLGALFLIYTLLAGGIDTGWTFYTPYSAHSGSAVISVSSSRICPALGSTKPAIDIRIVVLPDPDGPSSVRNEPRSMSRSTPSTAASDT